MHLESASPSSPPAKALIIMDGASQDLIYGPEERCDLEQHADFYAAPQTRESIAENPGCCLISRCSSPAGARR